MKQFSEKYDQKNKYILKEGFRYTICKLAIPSNTLQKSSEAEITLTRSYIM